MTKIRLLCAMMMILVLAAGGTAAEAATSWAIDAKTGCQVGWVSDYYTLVAASWTGPMVNGKAEGKGKVSLTLRNKNGREQLTRQGEAEMVAGLLDGKISLKDSDGDSYDGGYKAGLREGNGVFRHLNGDVYEGEYHNNLPNGKGKKVYAKLGHAYEGDFKDGAAEGQGIYRWPDGSTLKGTFKDGKPNGYAVERDAGGNVIYEGEWIAGKKVRQAE